MIEYEIVDFNGYMQWVILENGTYVVDPLYLEEFKEQISNKK